MSVQVNSTMTVRQTMAVAQLIPQYRQTEGQGRRRLLTPDEVLRLPNRELLCIIRGCNVLRLNKLDYTRHPMAERMERASIMDYRPVSETVCAMDEAALMEAELPVELAGKEPSEKRRLGQKLQMEKSAMEQRIDDFPTRSLYHSAKPPEDF